VCQEFEIEVEDGTIPRIAFGFAGGIGITGVVCGAVAGAVMAVGFKLGRGDTMEERLRRWAVSREFCRRFEAEMGTISCRELTGLDLTVVELTTEGMGQFMNVDVLQSVCFPAVGVAYQLVVNLLMETSFSGEA
jgi:C_GCAxxG_C_C family probable redox protein